MLERSETGIEFFWCESPPKKNWTNPGLAIFQSWNKFGTAWCFPYFGKALSSDFDGDPTNSHGVTRSHAPKTCDQKNAYRSPGPPRCFACFFLEKSTSSILFDLVLSRLMCTSRRKFLESVDICHFLSRLFRTARTSAGISPSTHLVQFWKVHRVFCFFSPYCVLCGCYHGASRMRITSYNCYLIISQTQHIVRCIPHLRIHRTKLKYKATAIRSNSTSMPTTQ
jgi:hypothetical protein